MDIFCIIAFILMVLMGLISWILLWMKKEDYTKISLTFSKEQK